ncbi:ran-binding protein 9-like [Mercenaria mercenaria]|uniref:ran-binding protein 9-like n=1 Tax=Mercenaria mercenaria TaxID=6596 RepID=UPI001E1D35A0|nr:ran-binding protein 9-like [Mercenaria mercenaria]
MAASNESGTGDSANSAGKEPDDRLKKLYPAVNEEETPLPRSWSAKDKFNYLGLSQNNLRVHYKGVGKTHKDAASVRATHPIPTACGIYYFEVKIISKGRDGYMGIGLAAQGVNQNRLPGWDKQSYGYHGDDGNSFCSSGQGEPYGPTFSTGDVIGCCVNLIDNTCFYTKNGVHLGIAFTDLPHGLYPTVGLQTPGEVVEANFGNSPFVYDIDDYMKEWKMKTRLTIERFPVNDKKGEWQTALQSIVSTYLVHHGYCATAEAFAKSTGQKIDEEIASIKNRQRISKLVLAGRMGEAIETTQQLYPGLLERNSNLLFMLKCRQFIEMVNGSDSEVRGAALRSPRSQHGGSNRSSPSRSPIHHTHSPRVNPLAGGTNSGNSSPNRTKTLKSHSNFQTPPQTSNSSPALNPAHTNSVTNSNSTNNQSDLKTISEENMNVVNTANSNSNSVTINGAETRYIEDVEMLDGIAEDENSVVTNGNSANGQYMNGNSCPQDKHDDMEIDPPSQKRQLCGGSQLAIEKMLQFGRELQSMSIRLRKEFGKCEGNKKQLQDAFSLLAYSDPWTSPVGAQLDPVQREPVCAALNSAILESHALPNKPPLELVISQTTECMKLMSKAGIASSAFSSTQDYLH